jgi:hypothetical protein
MAKINKDLLTMLFNHFYSNRWHLVGHVVRKAIEREIDCKDFPRTYNQMTIHGFFISNYPTLFSTMEKIDEYDLVTRLKMLNLIKKTTPTRTQKWDPTDKSRIHYGRHRYKNYVNYKEIMSNADKSTRICAGVKLVTK